MIVFSATTVSNIFWTNMSINVYVQCEPVIANWSRAREIVLYFQSIITECNCGIFCIRTHRLSFLQCSIICQICERLWCECFSAVWSRSLLIGFFFIFYWTKLFLSAFVFDWTKLSVFHVCLVCLAALSPFDSASQADDFDSANQARHLVWNNSAAWSLLMDENNIP